MVTSMEMNETLRERQQLAYERIRQIAADPEINGAVGDYFQKTGKFALLILRARELAEEDYFAKASVDELKAWNEKLYEDIAGNAYETSYANPAYAVAELGEEYGNVLSFVYTELRGMIVYAFEKRDEELLIHLELFLQIHSEFAEGDLPTKRQLGQDVYWFVSDYSDVLVSYRIREQLDPTLSFARDIIMKADLTDPSYLYQFGEYITDREIRMSEFLNCLSEAEIERIASVFTEGYRIGFEVNEKDLKKKRTVNIRYCLGFERIIRQAVKNFEEMGLESIIYRAAVSRVNMREANKIGYYSSSPNRQYDYDHKGDAALFLDKAFVERKLGVMRTTYEQYKELAAVHGGPAVMEIFGETPFEPAACPEAYKLADRQQENQVLLYSKSGQMTNEYIKGEERSFTIIAFPVPDIGEHFEEIFTETVKINTLDYHTYQRIQQTIIDALDKGTSVHIQGAGANRTDLTGALAEKQDAEKETAFENCVADVNIPVGEVFTSPVLAGTGGILHVKKVYLNGLQFRDLKLVFDCGQVIDYTCSNFETEEENRAYIEDNILFHHAKIPMGEFAIGTNTTAYVAAEKYGIADKLPILIAEKMGPHFAVGDTCYSWAEDTPVFNPDGREIIARDNEISALRKEDISMAYYGCHTDITIPYEELGNISVIDEEGESTPIIENGCFVLPGTEELNKPFEE